MFMCLGLGFALPLCAAEKREYPCYYVKEAPVMDGGLDDAVWQKAPLATGFHVSGGKFAVEKQTVFKILRTDDALYLAVKCFDPHADKMRAAGKDQDELWQDDSVELFFCPVDTKTYFQLIVNSKGARWGSANLSKPGEWRAVAKLDQDGWSAELKVPFDVLGKVPVRDATWRFNVARDLTTGPDSEKATSWPALERGFNDVTNFAYLQFKQDPPGNEEINGQSRNMNAGYIQRRLQKNTRQFEPLYQEAMRNTAGDSKLAPVAAGLKAKWDLANKLAGAKESDLKALCSAVNMAIDMDLAAEINYLTNSCNNLIPGDSSFEITPGVCMVQADLDPPLITWRIDKTTAAVGRSSLLVENNATEPASALSSTFYLQPGRYTFSFYGKTDSGTNCVSSLLRGPSHGGDNFLKYHYLTSAWQRYSYPLELTKAGNYNFFFCFRTFPCRIWFDAFQLTLGDLATPYHPRDNWTVALNVPSDTWKVYYPCERIPVEMGVYASATDLDKRGLQFSYEIIDFFGRPVQSDEKKVSLDKRGYYDQALSFNPGKAGYYVIKAKIQRKGEVLGQGLTAVTVVDPPVRIEAGKEPFCGIACTADKFAGLWRMGAKWAEIGCGWAGEEEKQGQGLAASCWKSMDWRIISLYQHGFKIKMQLNPQSPGWAVDPVELKEKQAAGLSGELLPARERVADYAAFVRRMILRYRDFVSLYEFGGEDNLKYSLLNDFYKKKYPESVVKVAGDLVPEEHTRGQGLLNLVDNASFVVGPVADRAAELYCAAIDQVRQLDPGKKVGILRPSSYGHKLSYIYDREVMKRMPDKFDLFAMDPYFMCAGLPGLPEKMPGSYMGGGAPEEALVTELRRGSELTEQYAKGQPIYVSEVGMTRSIFAEPDSEIARIAAKYIARSYLTARMTPNVTSCHWYIETLEGTHQSTIGTPQAFGFWLRGNPYPQVAAYSAVAQVIENVAETCKLELGPGIWCIVFRKSNGADAALWMSKGEAERSVKSVDGVTIRDVVGSPVTAAKENNKLILKITGYPLYLHCNGADAYNILLNMLSAN